MRPAISEPLPGTTCRRIPLTAAAEPSVSRQTSLDHRQLAVDHQQNPIQLMAAAQDQASGRDHAVGALLACQPRILLDAMERTSAGAPNHREYRAVFQEIDGVVPPLAIGDHSS